LGVKAHQPWSENHTKLIFYIPTISYGLHFPLKISTKFILENIRLNLIKVTFYFFNFLKIYLFERERVSNGEGQMERERENLKQTPH